MKNHKVFSLSELIQQYKEILREQPDSQKLKPMYRKIEHEIMLITYFLPQTRLGLDEEDASEFMFFMQDKIPGIIDSYDESYDSFLAYYSAALRLRLKNFKTKKSRSERLDNSMFRGHFIYEYILNEETTLQVAEENQIQSDNKKLNTLRCIMYYSKTARKRFYILFISVAPFMSVNEIEDICTTLSYDFKSTMKIIESLSSFIEKTQEEYIQIEERRNFYFSFLLNLEFQKDPDSDDPYLKEKINENRQKYQSKVEQLTEYQRKIPSVKIGEIFNLNRKTVGSFMFFSRNIINFCLADSPKKQNDYVKLGLTEKVVTKVLEQGDSFSNTLPVLNPFDLYDIKLN